MKILFVTSVVPYPPNNGIRIVPYNALRLMAGSGHSVCLCALSAEDDQGPEGMSNEARFNEIRPMVDEASFWMQLQKSTFSGRVLQGVGIEPSFIKFYKSKEFTRRLEAVIAAYNPDVIHFDFINMCSYRHLAPDDVRTVASVNDSIALAMENRIKISTYRNGLIKWAKHLQLLQIKRYEKTVYPSFTTVHLMTDVDAAYLEKLNPAIDTTVISNGVDDRLFEVPIYYGENNQKALFIGELKGNNLINIRRFVEQSWLLIRERCPNATLDIVGAHTTASRRWASETQLEGIRFVGYVEDLVEAYKDPAIAIIPIDKNSGIMNKAIEAMAAGVVPIGFHNSFLGVKGAKRESEFLAGENFEEIGELIADLLMDSSRRSRLAENARAVARRHYSWDSKYSEFKNMYTGH